MHEKQVVGSHVTDTLSEIMDLVLSAGPNIGEALEELQLAVEDGRSMVAHLQQAGLHISGRAATERGEVVALTDAEQAKLAEIEAKAAEHERAGRRGLLSDLFTFVKANPWLAELILKLVMKK